MEEEVKEFLHMNKGDGDLTYAEHSRFTQMIAAATKEVVESSIWSVLSLNNNKLTEDVLHVADLGCAAGPNTFVLMRTVMEAVKKRWFNLDLPEIQFYLNDLPGNDFNSLFKGLSSYDFGAENNKKKMRWFAVASAGSFYDRLFPSNTLHFIHSSYSVHWLSKMPSSGLIEVDEQSRVVLVPVNKGSTYISETSPPMVKKAYLDQFRDDFTRFLNFRSEEMVPNGILALFLHGRLTVDPVAEKDSRYVWDLLSQAISHLISQGLVEQHKLDSFNVPYYMASTEEVAEIVEVQGSFSIQRLETFQLDAFEKGTAIDVVSLSSSFCVSEGEKRANNIRVFTEPLLSHHFGEKLMDPLFDQVTRLCIQELTDFPQKDHSTTTIVLVMRRN